MRARAPGFELYSWRCADKRSYLPQILEIQASTSALLLGNMPDRFSQPSEVIKMSSSILTPIPRNGSGTS